MCDGVRSVHRKDAAVFPILIPNIVNDLCRQLIGPIDVILGTYRKVWITHGY